MQRTAILLSVALFVTGCASITKGTDQTVQIDTPGFPGAQCFLSSKAIGERSVTTPAIVTLDKSRHDINVQCKHGCYRGSGVISSNLEGMTAGNLLVGGVVGLGVDAATGAMNKYAQYTQISMVPDPGCINPAPPQPVQQ